MHEAILLMKFPRWKPHIKIMKVIYFESYFTVIKNLSLCKSVLQNRYQVKEVKSDIW